MDRFGDLIMLQMPETMRDPIGDGRFTYLALFNDLNRIDLQIIPADRYEGMLGNDSQTMLLLDKDNIVPAPPPASDASYHVKRPAANDFYSCCNNFWWCLQNVAKGIWRDELPYAMQTYERYVRAELDCMVEWQIGMLNGFQVSAGKWESTSSDTWTPIHIKHIRIPIRTGNMIECGIQCLQCAACSGPWPAGSRKISTFAIQRRTTSG